MRHDVPEIATILTHIESEPATIEQGEQIVQEPKLERHLKQIVKEFPEVVDVHEFQFKKNSRPAVCLMSLHSAR